jgi:carbon monoxide dehydrogenase subunit G
MKVELERTYPVTAPADAAWVVLSDIESVAACMPGAAITERIDATHFKGTVSVKFGPASMSFRGEVELVESDAATRRIRLAGKGVDSTGSSGASLDLTAHLESAEAGQSRLVGKSEVSVSGKAAAFGGRMMTSVADQVLKQFAANFGQAAQAHNQNQPPKEAQAVESTSGRGTPGPGAAPSHSAPGAAASTAPGPGSGNAPSKPLNGLALLWSLLRDWLRALVGTRPA